MRRPFLLLWALVAAVACWRLDPLHRPVTGDNQLYFYLAERAASGVAPHVSHVDTKNQLGVLVTATAMAAGRRVGGDDVVSSRIVSIAFTAMSVALAAELATLLAGSAMAGHVAALALLAARGFVEHSAAGNNPKIFLAAFLLLAHVAMAAGWGRGQGARPLFAAGDARSATRQRGDKFIPQRGGGYDWIAGTAAASAFLCWQPALLVVAAVAFEARWSRGGSWRRMLTLLGAALVPVVVYELYFFVHGALGEQLRQAYEMTLGSVHQPVRLLRSVAFVLTEATHDWIPPRVGPLSFALLAAGLLARLAVSPAGTIASLRERAGMISFVLGGAGATAFTLYDHQGVPDLFFPDPYFAVATGLLVAWVMRVAGRAVDGEEAAEGAVAGGGVVGRDIARPAAALVALAMSAVLVWQMRHDEGGRRAPGYDLADQQRAADVVRGYRDSGDSVWVYGAVHLLGLAHLDNHVPYGLFYDDVESAIAVDDYLPLREGRMPTIIIHGRDEIPGSARYLTADYQEFLAQGFAPQSLHTWARTVRKSGSGTDFRSEKSVPDPDLPDSPRAPGQLPSMGPRPRSRFACGVR